MDSDNRQTGRPSQILPLVIAAFAGATLAIACERPASRVASGEPRTPAVPAAEEPRAKDAAAPAPAAREPATIARESLADTVIAGRIKTAILSDPGMAGADVTVSTDRGSVTLLGSVKSHEQIAIASAHAQRQDGVTRVDNHLSVPVS